MTEGIITIRCLKPPVIKPDEQVILTSVGATTEVQGSHYWAGQAARGNVEIVVEQPDKATETVEKPKTKKK
jgi:hypothetical protein